MKKSANSLEFYTKKVYNERAKQNCIFFSIRRTVFCKGCIIPFCRSIMSHFEFDKNANSTDEVSYIIGSYLSYTILFGDKSVFAFFGAWLRLRTFLY